MCLALAVLLFMTLGDPVLGLKPGETVVELDPGLALDLDSMVRARILKANTGEPVEDVLVEAWTENGENPVSIELCLDRAKTNAGGQVELDCRRPGMSASKVRLSKLGFASATVSLSDLFDLEVRLSPQQPLDGRVLDLAGKPVVGAIIRTRETCAHAVPAAQTRTDSLGRFRLTDCPIGDNDPEIEVLGELIAPLFHLDGGDLRKLAAFHGRLDLYVARRAPIDMRVIDDRGAPLAHRRVVKKDAPMYESWTDADGLCRMFPPNDGRETTFYLTDVGPELMLLSHFVPGVVTIVTPLRIEDAPEFPARLRIVWSGRDESARAPRASFVSSAGDLFWVEDADSKLPLGAGRLFIGGRFEAYAPEDLALEMRAGEQEVHVAVTRNPLLRVKLPEHVRSLIEAGDDSVELRTPTREQDVIGSFVAPGMPITVFCESGDGEIRRVTLSSLTADAEVDLTAPSAIVRPGLGRSAEDMRTLRFDVTDRAGKPIDGVEGRVFADSTALGYAPTEIGSVQWPLPAFSSYRVALHAPGFTSVYLQGVVRGREDNHPMRVSLQRRAHLTLRGAIAGVIVPGTTAEVTDGAFEIDVAPGPLTLRVLRLNQAPLAIELTLAEGETRTLEVR